MMTATKINTSALNSEHKEFAAEYHDEVVYGFLGKRRLSRDLYYDIVIFKYLYAVQIYLERPELQKYTFKTIAYRQMTGALNNHWKKMARPKHSARVISLHSLYDGGVEEQMGVRQPISMEEHYEATEDWRLVMQQLTPRELDILQKRVAGYTYHELAEEAGISYSGMCSRFYRIRVKARACLAAAV